jgi:hypothetical protein
MRQCSLIVAKMLGKRCGRPIRHGGATPEQDTCNIQRLTGKQSSQFGVPSSMSTSGKQSKATPKPPPKNRKSSHTWSLPIRSVVVVELLERAKMGVVVVDDLLESRIANTASRLNVSTR